MERKFELILTGKSFVDLFSDNDPLVGDKALAWPRVQMRRELSEGVPVGSDFGKGTQREASRSLVHRLGSKGCRCLEGKPVTDMLIDSPKLTAPP